MLNPTKSMNKEKLLSIIIPVYNVEKYIGRCLDSIYNQKVDEELFEVIVVNDGTPDNSVSIIEKYVDKKEDSNHSLMQCTRCTKSYHPSCCPSTICPLNSSKFVCIHHRFVFVIFYT